MDAKEMITKAVKKITEDDKMREQFTKDPVKTVEGILGIDLPDDVVNQVIDGIKAKISVDKLGSLLGKFTK